MAHTIRRGSRVLVRTAFGDQLERRAGTGVEPGYSFPVVWICSEEEWAQARRENREPSLTPWPADDVTPIREPVSP